MSSTCCTVTAQERPRADDCCVRGGEMSGTAARVRTAVNPAAKPNSVRTAATVKTMKRASRSREGGMSP